MGLNTHHQKDISAEVGFMLVMALLATLSVSFTQMN